MDQKTEQPTSEKGIDAMINALRSLSDDPCCCNGEGENCCDHEECKCEQAKKGQDGD